MSRDKPTTQHDPKRDKPDDSLPPEAGTKPSTPSGKPDQELPPEAGTKPVEPTDPAKPDQTLPPAPDQSLPPMTPRPGHELPTPPHPPALPGQPLPTPPVNPDQSLPTPPAKPDQGLPDDGTTTPEDKRVVVLQAEQELNGTVVWLDEPATFPDEENAEGHLKAIRVEETKEIEARIAAGSEGGKTGRFRIVVRETTEKVITVVDFLHDPDDAEPKDADA